MDTNTPNILIIMTDQHSKHFLGCYGNETVRTPNLDHLAQNGTIFPNAYCPAPVCVPSRMSFMTTLFPRSTGVWNNENLLSSGIPTWAHALGIAGYETSLIGRMHFDGKDQYHGFERRIIGEPTAKHPGASLQGGPAWTKFPHSTSAQCRESVEIAGRGKTFYQWFDEEITRYACNFIEEKGKNPQKKPFAAVVGYVLPHCPFIAPKELFNYYYDEIKLPDIEERQPQIINDLRNYRNILSPALSEKQIRVALAAYYGLCEYSDYLIGKVLQAVEANNLSKNTIVIYCSDHGEMAGEHGLWWKSCFYEGSVSVPLIISYPNVIPSDRINNSICNLTDIGSTLIDIAGADPLPYSDGNSLWPQLSGSESTEWNNETFSEIVDLPVDHGKDLIITAKNIPARMIRSGKWKLWYYDDGDKNMVSLFNLEEDPQEIHDLAGQSQYRDVVKELTKKILHDWEPKKISSNYYRNAQYYEYLTKWGKTIEPIIPETLPFPSPEFEKDVELL